MVAISKLIPGGEIRTVSKGDKSTYKGETKEASKDYVMIKLTSRKTPVFIDEQIFRIVMDLAKNDEFKQKMGVWFK